MTNLTLLLITPKTEGNLPATFHAALPDVKIQTLATLNGYRESAIAAIVFDLTEQPSGAMNRLAALKKHYIHVPIFAIVDESIDLASVYTLGIEDCLRLPLQAAEITHRVGRMVAFQQARLSTGEVSQMLLSMKDFVGVIDREGRYVRIFSASSDYQERDLIGDRIADHVPDPPAGDIMLMIEEAFVGQQTQSLDYTLTIDDEKRHFHAVITPVDDEQVLWVGQDVTHYRQAEMALQESERRYRDVFQYANDSILLIDIETSVIVDANRKALNELGYRRDDLIGKSIREIEVSATNDEDTVTALESNDTVILVHRYRHRDGTLIPVETSSRIISYDDRPTVLSFSRNITLRNQAQKAERDQRLFAESLQQISSLINSSLELDEVLDLILENATSIVTSASANIMLIDGDIAQMARHRGYTREGLTEDQIHAMQLSISETPTLSIIKETKRPYIVDDVRADERWVNLSTSYWIRSHLSAPILIKGEVAGFISVDSDQVGAFTAADGEKLQAFAIQAGIAIRNATLFAQVQDSNEALERRVAERTAALTQANEALRQQIVERHSIEDELATERNLLRAVMDAVPDIIYYKDQQGRYMLANQGSLDWFGFSDMSHLIGKTNYDLIPLSRAQEIEQGEKRLIETGETISFMLESTEQGDTPRRHYLVTKTPFYDQNGAIIGLIGVNRDITDVKQTEQQLEQVLKSARCLLWHAIVRTDGDDHDWALQVTNEEAAQSFLPLDTTGRTYTDAWQASILEEDRFRRDYVFKMHLKFNRMTYNMELRCLQADGSVRWLMEDVRIQPLGENRYELVAVCTDITARKETEAALQATNDELEKRVEERTSELVEANDILMMEIEERLKAEESERNQRILAEALRDTVASLNKSLERDDLLDELLDSIVHVVPHDAGGIFLIDERKPDQAHIVRRRGYGPSHDNVTLNLDEWPDLQAVRKTHKPSIISDSHAYTGWVEIEGMEWVRSNLTVPIRLGDEVIGFLNVDSRYPNNFSPEQGEQLLAFADQAGNAIHNARLVESIRQHAAELEKRVAERTAQLEYERAQLHAILNAMRDGVVYQGIDGKLHYINPAMIEIAGYDASDWSSLTYLKMMAGMGDEVQRQRFRSRMLRALELNGYWDGEATFMRKDGTTFDAAIARVSVADPSNQTEGVLTVVRDISQAKQLEQQKSRFIAIAAHELRTPIANLKTRLYLLNRQREKFDEHIDVAMSVINWMQKLVENMFDISRFERGVIVLERERVDVQRLINSIVAMHAPGAERQHIELITEMPDEPIVLFIDPYRMSQVIINLLTNAVNYTDTNGRVTITVKTQTEPNGRDKLLVIAVTDTGRGIETNNLPYLFQPFFRAQDDNRGAGLGLSIAQDIVRLHDGTIRVESEVGVGSRFIVALPMKHNTSELRDTTV